MSKQQILPIFSDAISLEESADGSTPCNSPDGRTNGRSGRGRVRASRSVSPGNVKAKRTSDTFGQSFIALSKSANLQQSLANRLRQKMDANGSPEYVLTWKTWAMKSGPRICALRALAPRTQDNAFIGWPTPTVPVNTNGHQSGNNRFVTKCVSVMKGWATPRARDGKGNGMSIARAAKGVADSLDLQCKLVCLSRTVPPSPLSARMDAAAYPLNPMHSLWLMGYPSEWESFADTVTPSSRK